MTDHPQPPALGYYAWQAAVAEVETSPRHATCGRVTDEGVFLGIIDVDGRRTYHEITGQKMGCLLRELDSDPRVEDWWLCMPTPHGIHPCHG